MGLFPILVGFLMVLASAAVPQTDSCSVEMETETDYQYKEVPQKVNIQQISRMTFTVKACHDAHVVISEGDKNQVDQDKNMYEIVIGGWGNTMSVLRNEKQGPHLVQFKHKPLSCNEYRGFYVSWKDGRIEVGTTESNKPFLSYKPNNAGFPVKHAYVTGWKADYPALEWKFDVPCVKPNTDTCPVEIKTYSDFQYKEVKVPEGVTLSQITRMTFSVKACMDTHLIISEGDKNQVDQGKNMYMIVIGSWENKVSFISNRKESSSHLSQTEHSVQPLSCNEYRGFYVSWKDGHIEVGTTASNKPFLSYKASNAGFPVKHVFVNAWNVDNPASEWKFEFPCDKHKTSS